MKKKYIILVCIGVIVSLLFIGMVIRQKLINKYVENLEYDVEIYYISRANAPATGGGTIESYYGLINFEREKIYLIYKKYNWGIAAIREGPRTKYKCKTKKLSKVQIEKIKDIQHIYGESIDRKGCWCLEFKNQKIYIEDLPQELSFMKDYLK